MTKKTSKMVNNPIVENGPESLLLRHDDQVAPKRFLIFTPTLGTIRMEWARARYGATIPTNFSTVDYTEFLNPIVPIGFSLTDAENLAAKRVVEGDYEWLLQIEDDNLIPADAFIKINSYMMSKKYPVVGGLYFTRSHPPEPILYRGRGTGAFADWRLGDKVMVDGLPFGFTLIHGDIIRELWKISPEYRVGNTVTRRVFSTPIQEVYTPEGPLFVDINGTSDLHFFTRIKEQNILEKAGWPELQKEQYPYLVDTTIFVKHIERTNGAIYPISLPKDFLEGKITWAEAISQY